VGARSQPTVSDDGKLVITFNREIYSYPALRKKLASTPPPPPKSVASLRA
jgi:asparagine synthetase B (glutamine-hydrolysing)